MKVARTIADLFGKVPENAETLATKWQHHQDAQSEVGTLDEAQASEYVQQRRDFLRETMPSQPSFCAIAASHLPL
jgi:hypothetical protein